MTGREDAMKKHRFRFSKESRESLERFGEPEKQESKPETVEAPASEAAEPQPVTAQAAAQPEDAVGFTVAVRTHVGLVRASNQDAVIHDGHLCGVADGMGGHNGGEVASAGARDRLIELLHGKEPDPTELHQAIRTVNRKLFIQAAENEALSGMGTTLTALWFGPECVYIGHVGDSRCYQLRDGELKQITDDHSLVAEMLRAGILTAEQAAAHPMKNVITRAVGTEASVVVDMTAVVRKPGDRWLVCSDGLHGLVSDEQLRDALADNPPEQAADLLLQAALDAGGRDNISLVIVDDREALQ